MGDPPPLRVGYSPPLREKTSLFAYGGGGTSGPFAPWPTGWGLSSGANPLVWRRSRLLRGSVREINKPPPPSENWTPTENVQDRWSAQRGHPSFGPKAVLLARGRPDGGQKWPKIGLKRAFFRGTAKIPTKYAKKRLFCLRGTFVLDKGAVRTAAGHLWRQKLAVHRFSRCFNTSTSGVQRKSNTG